MNTHKHNLHQRKYFSDLKWYCLKTYYLDISTHAKLSLSKDKNSMIKIIFSKIPRFPWKLHLGCESLIISSSASILYKRLIMWKCDVAYINVLRKIAFRQNEVRDIEIFKFSWRNLPKMFDLIFSEILPPAELLLRWDHLLNSHLFKNKSDLWRESWIQQKIASMLYRERILRQNDVS